MSRIRVGVVGGGALARAIVRSLIAIGHHARLWARRPEARAQLAAELLGAEVVEDIMEITEDAQILVLAVPSSAFREVLRSLGNVVTPDQFVLHASRGVCDDEGFVLPHQAISEETCLRKIGVLGGPLYAPELYSDLPLAVVLASRFEETWELGVRLTAGSTIRVHPSPDVLGVEVAGAMSNVTALAVGMSDALGLGQTASGVLLTRGLSEAAKLGDAMGASARTFTGLAGVGDLIPRRVESTDRHHAVGHALAVGTSCTEALADQHGEVEGVRTAPLAVAAGDALGVELVLARAIAGVCAGRLEARGALEGVLHRHLDLGQGLV